MASGFERVVEDGVARGSQAGKSMTLELLQRVLGGVLLLQERVGQDSSLRPGFARRVFGAASWTLSAGSSFYSSTAPSCTLMAVLRGCGRRRGDGARGSGARLTELARWFCLVAPRSFRRNKWAPLSLLSVIYAVQNSVPETVRRATTRVRS